MLKPQQLQNGSSSIYIFMRDRQEVNPKHHQFQHDPIGPYLSTCAEQVKAMPLWRN
jgi:hypothetical protein